jgi:hypothetical protein
VDPRAQELSEALIDICSSTAAGSKASATTKQEIQELVRGQQQVLHNLTQRWVSQAYAPALVQLQVKYLAIAAYTGSAAEQQYACVGPSKQQLAWTSAACYHHHSRLRNRVWTSCAAQHSPPAETFCCFVTVL